MPRTRIKICGITRQSDAEVAVAMGADAVGFVFWAQSPRAVQLEHIAPVINALPAFVAGVGLFVNASAIEVAAVLAKAKLSALQFHGDETPAFCESFGLPYLKAIRVKSSDTPDDVFQAAAAFASASGILLDTYRPGVPGGTGETFNWQAIPPVMPRPLILSGGLTPHNVMSAVMAVRPWAVDVSSGVELSKGIKDHAKVSEFIALVSAVDHQKS